MNDSTGGRMPTAPQDDTFDLDLPGGEKLLAARAVAPPSADVLARVQAVVDAAVERELTAAAPHDAPAAAAPARHRLLRRRWIVSSALVAAAATGIAVLPTVSFGGKPPASANAATFLNELADRTEAAPPTSAVGRLKGAPYWEIMSIQTGGNPEPESTTTFISAKDGSQRVYTGTSGEYLKVTNTLLPTMHWWLGGNRTVDLAGLDRLPTDTAHLRAALTAGNSSNAGLFFQVVDLLESPASPKLRAALFRVLSQLPGIHLDGTREDVLGRSGTQISMKLPSEFKGDWETLLVQPRTGTLLQHDVYTPTNSLLPHGADTFLWAGPVWKLPPDLRRK